MDILEALQGFLLLRAAVVSPSTWKTDQAAITDFAEWYGPADVGEVTSDVVQRYVRQPADRGLGPATIRRRLTSLSAFYTWLMSADVVLVDHHLGGLLADVPPSLVGIAESC